MTEVLVLIDAPDGKVTKPSLELLTIARRIGEPSAVVFGSADTGVLAEYGAEKIYTYDDAVYGEYLVGPKAEALVEAVLRLIDEPDLAPLFGPRARAEVALAGSILVGGRERPVSGRIDRLAVTDEAVWLCDFKTGRPPARHAPLPEAETAQIALYAALLERIYPGRRVRPMLVWTVGPVLRRLDDAEIAAALDGMAGAAA